MMELVVEVKVLMRMVEMTENSLILLVELKYR